MPRAAKLSALALIMTVLSAMAWVTPAMAITVDTSIDSGPAAGSTTNLTGATFTFSSLTAGATFECKRDGSLFSVCTSPKVYTSLTDGAHTFYVRATDPISHVVDSTPASRTWTVDTTPPSTSITGGPSGPVTGTTASFSFTSSEALSTFECALTVLPADVPVFAPCTSPKIYSGVIDGSHIFSVRATDSVGNTDATPATRSWQVDTTTPVVQIDSGPTEASIVSSSSATFGFSETADTPTSPVTFQCSLDGAAYTTCTSTKTYSLLSQGAHVFRVQATDKVGLVSAPATRSWTVKTTTPDTIIDSGPTSTKNATSTFTFHSTEAGSTFECKVDLGVYGPCVSPLDVGPLGDGTHTFYVRASDTVTPTPHTDLTPATRTWTIDSTDPDTFIYSGPGGTVSSSLATFTFDSSEPGSTFKCEWDLDGSWVPCTSPVSRGGLPDGLHQFRVQATDPAGNVDPTPEERDWTILGGDTTPPTAVIDSGPTGTVPDTSATFTFHSTETPATFKCQLDGSAWAACTSPKTYAGPLLTGAHTFSVKAYDASLNESALATRTWTIGLVPTTLSIRAPASAKHGTRVTVSGVLSSDDPTCESAQKVYLKAGTSTLGPRTTSTTGAYSYSVYIGTSNKGVRAVYKGTTKCAASSSERLVITST